LFLGTRSSLRSVSLISPAVPLPILPLAILLDTVRGDINAHAMLLTLQPLASVASTIRPDHLADSLFLVLVIVTQITATITPREEALALHFIINPVAFVLPTVWPHHYASALYFPIVEVSDEDRPIIPLEAACSVLAAEGKQSIVCRAVSPLLFPISVLLISLPVASILSAILVEVDSFTFG